VSNIIVPVGICAKNSIIGVRSELSLDLVEAAQDQGEVVVRGQELTEGLRPQPVAGDGGMTGWGLS
jgi:hypothetical protein